MGHDKLIPHSSDAATSDILITLLSHVHLLKLQPKSTFRMIILCDLYKGLLFVNFNHKFTSEDLSTIMSKYSLPGSSS